MTEQTLFQQLIVEEYAEDIIEDLEAIDFEEMDGAEIALGVTEADLPRIIEELEELTDDEQ